MIVIITISFIFALRYASFMSVTATSLSSTASKMVEMNKASCEIVREAVSSFDYSPLCTLSFSKQELRLFVVKKFLP